MAFVKKFMPLGTRKKINIPGGMTIDGIFKIDRKLVAADFNAIYAKGLLKAKGFFNGADNTYNIVLQPIISVLEISFSVTELAASRHR